MLWRPLEVFKTRDFARLIRKSDITDRALREAVERASQGMVDAALGSGLIKQRVARQCQGRSGCYRTVIALGAGRAGFFPALFRKKRAGEY